eukprot:8232501-Pyramimonas_sp.AAC.1
MLQHPHLHQEACGKMDSVAMASGDTQRPSRRTVKQSGASNSAGCMFGVAHQPYLNIAGFNVGSPPRRTTRTGRSS